MRIPPKPILFEWDKGNIDKNLNKHNVSNKEAEEVFVNNPHFILEDEKHSTNLEKRFMLWGETDVLTFVRQCITFYSDCPNRHDGRRYPR